MHTLAKAMHARAATDLRLICPFGAHMVYFCPLNLVNFRQ
jgi:hypothetical protein